MTDRIREKIKGIINKKDTTNIIIIVEDEDIEAQQLESLTAEKLIELDKYYNKQSEEVQEEIERRGRG